MSSSVTSIKKSTIPSQGTSQRFWYHSSAKSQSSPWSISCKKITSIRCSTTSNLDRLESSSPKLWPMNQPSSSLKDNPPWKKCWPSSQLMTKYMWLVIFLNAFARLWRRLPPMPRVQHLLLNIVVFSLIQKSSWLWSTTLQAKYISN